MNFSTQVIFQKHFCVDNDSLFDFWSNDTLKNKLKSMEGKVCMVTGATSGIGDRTALALALQGATTLVVGRNLKRCLENVKKIKNATGNESVEHILADLCLQNVFRLLR